MKPFTLAVFFIFSLTGCATQMEYLTRDTVETNSVLDRCLSLKLKCSVDQNTRGTTIHIEQ